MSFKLRTFLVVSLLMGMWSPAQAELEAQFATQGERAAVRAAEAAWRQHVDSTAELGMPGPDGVWVVPAGYAAPTLACAPLHACTVRLVPGERITAVALGDTVRWLSTTAEAGGQSVVVVKPTHPGIRTNLVVTTDRRVYDITLIAEKGPAVGRSLAFRDPAAEEAALAQSVRERLQQQPGGTAGPAATKSEAPASASSASSSVLPEGLRGRMVCTGSARVLPELVLVGDDRTYIAWGRSPAEWPAVYGVLPSGESRVLHTRRVGDAMVVDGVHEQLRLAIGTPEAMDEAICRRP